jgi:hypothetical protein
MRPQQILGVILLEAEHSVETIDLADPFGWRPPAGLGDGFLGHPGAWPVPTLFAVANGATGRSSAQCAPEALRGVAEAVERLDGRCDVIAGGCGYFGAAWSAIGTPPATPTVLSALDYLDAALSATSRDVAVLSMNGQAARDFLGGRPDAGRCRVIGLDDAGHWPLIARPDWVTDPQWTLKGLEQGLREVLTAAAVPGGALDDVGALLLECTVLPQFHSVVREYTRAPIYDVAAMVRQLLA